ncbi:MAG: DUF4412 domain-containing protein [Gemmatimonadales bacterium]
MWRAVLVASLSVAGAAPAQRFEGTLTTKRASISAEAVAEHAGEDRDKIFALTLERLVELGASLEQSTTLVKGSRFRTDVGEMPGGGRAYMILNAETSVMQSVMPGQRAYYEVNLARLPIPEAPEEAEKDLKVEPLGKTQTINGLRCTAYRVTGGDGEAVSIIWATQDADFRSLFESQMKAFRRQGGEERGGGGWAAKAQAQLKKYGFPVMTQELDEDGSYSVELFVLSRVPQPDSLFVVPAGFRKVTTPGE